MSNLNNHFGSKSIMRTTREKKLRVRYCNKYPFRMGNYSGPD